MTGHGAADPPLHPMAMRTGRRARLLLVALMLAALVTLACNIVGLGNAINQRDNAVRRAALTYELQTRGSADELLVDFGFLEWRDNLGFTNGRTVWLNPVARDEFFAERDARRTYLYLRSPIEQDGDVLMEVERGGPDGVDEHRLTLQMENDTWQVTGDDELR
jgi:predicted small secreted protein